VNLYVVFVCRDDPAKVRANVARRDDISHDDHVIVYLDTFHDRKRAYRFAVNPFGVQQDGILTDGQSEDLSFDAVWSSEGRMTDSGYVNRAGIEGLADLAFARGDWRKARDLFGRIAVDAHPDLYLRLAEVDRALGEPAVAERFERQFLAVARAPDAEALYAHPLALYYASSLVTIDTALAIARRDVARRPAVECYDGLSWVLFRRGDLAVALAASDQALRWGMPTPTMDFHRAGILEALGRTTESAALLKPVLAQPSLLE